MTGSAAASVALLAEGVDRNFGQPFRFIRESIVALLAEGVDRNLSSVPLDVIKATSPSSRRAWIEILEVCPLLK